jgi:hypothetical protein
VLCPEAVTTPSKPPAAVPDPPGMSMLISPFAVSAIRRRTSSGNTVSKPAEVAAAFRSSRLIGGQEVMIGLYVRAPTSRAPCSSGNPEYLKPRDQRQIRIAARCAIRRTVSPYRGHHRGQYANIKILKGRGRNSRTPRLPALEDRIAKCARPKAAATPLDA